MTAEVIVMNRNGVALAADSAVTIVGNGQIPKVYNSANKLFKISKDQPIGVLIYNAASLNNAPFDLIVKDFRKKNNNKTWLTVEDCTQAFINYLEAPFFDTISCNSYLIDNALQQLENLINVDKKNNPNHNINLYGKDLLSKLKKDDNHQSIDDSFFNTISQKWASYIKNFLTKILQATNDQILNDYTEICIHLILKNEQQLLLKSYTGIAFVGFGENEYYPTCVHIDIFGIICNKVVYQNRNTISISMNNQMQIIPLAQTENVYTYIMGISNQIQDSVTRCTKEISKAVIKQILDEVQQKANITLPPSPSADDYSEKISIFLLRAIQTLTRENRDKIYRALRFLSIPDLAQMAKSLVELTSLKKRISLECDTVGGPIDVAVISKGDGFIWIDRKHYFKKELNEHFFTEYEQK